LIKEEFDLFFRGKNRDAEAQEAEKERLYQ